MNHGLNIIMLNIVTFNLLIDIFCKECNVLEAQGVLKTMTEMGVSKPQLINAELVQACSLSASSMQFKLEEYFIILKAFKRLK
jgi:pentatricopeptide repeat protein